MEDVIKITEMVFKPSFQLVVFLFETVHSLRFALNSLNS